MIWIAWINGSLYVELHGQQDGRTRFFVFVQMAILVLLAVFTANAAGSDGGAFAITYASFLAVNAWLWLSVGFGMIYFLAALQAVDAELYEAAEVDGAGHWSKFWNVTIPGIKPVLLFHMMGQLDKQFC